MSIHQTAAGVIIFRTDSNQHRTWLVIRNAAGHWELPKGHIEPGEDWQTAALRELQEETGITKVQLMPGFARMIRYAFRDRKKGLIYKTVTFAVAESFDDEIQISDEHIDFALLDFESAMNRLTHAGTRALLRDAQVFIHQRVS